MLEILHFESERVIGMRIDGKLSEDDIQTVVDIAELKLSAMGEGSKLRVYVEVEHFGGLSLEALWKDLKFGLRHLGDFERKAVVSDREWMGRLAAIVDPLFPSVHVRHFSPDQREDARAWVRD